MTDALQIMYAGFNVAGGGSKWRVSTQNAAYYIQRCTGVPGRYTIKGQPVVKETTQSGADILYHGKRHFENVPI